MAMILPQPLHHVLGPKLPQVRLLSTASDVNNLTTYTFTGMDIGGFGGGTPFAAVENVVIDTPLLAASGKKMILAIVHGEDANATFNVSSATIGGVGGTELVDRGGGTNAVNTAIYGWSDQALADIANTDVVVAWSEAITCCAVGIVEISFLRSFGSIAAGSATGTGLLTANLAGTDVTEGMHGGVAIMGATCVTGGGTEQIGPDPDGNSQLINHLSSILLYEGNNAEIDFAAYYALTPSVVLNTGSVVRTVTGISWSGTGAGDVAGVFLL